MSKLMNQCIFLLLFLSLSTSAFSAAPDSFKFHVDRFQLEGFIPFDTALVDSTLEPFLNQEHTLDSLLKASNTLEVVIREQDEEKSSKNMTDEKVKTIKTNSKKDSLGICA